MPSRALRSKFLNSFIWAHVHSSRQFYFDFVRLFVGLKSGHVTSSRKFKNKSWGVVDPYNLILNVQLIWGHVTSLGATLFRII